MGIRRNIHLKTFAYSTRRGVLIATFQQYSADTPIGAEASKRLDTGNYFRWTINDQIYLMQTDPFAVIPSPPLRS